jgi:hypothetical protein
MKLGMAGETPPHDMKPVHDLLVGVVAIIVGALLLLGAIFDAATLMSLAKSRLLSEAVSRTGARWIIGAIGVVVIAMGVLIASGWRIRW